MARPAGLFARRVKDRGDLAAAAPEVLGHAGPVSLDVMTARQELVMPPKTEWAQAASFSLWAVKALLNGRADEMIDLARTNLLR